jgi:hypothetical protein
VLDTFTVYLDYPMLAIQLLDVRYKATVRLDTVRCMRAVICTVVVYIMLSVAHVPWTKLVLYEIVCTRTSRSIAWIKEYIDIKITIPLLSPGCFPHQSHTWPSHLAEHKHIQTIHFLHPLTTFVLLYDHFELTRSPDSACMDFIASVSYSLRIIWHWCDTWSIVYVHSTQVSNWL